MTSRVQVRAGDVVSIFSSDGKTPLGKLTVESSGDGIIWIRGESVVAKVGDVMVVHPSPHDPETCWHCRNHPNPILSTGYLESGERVGTAWDFWKK